MTELPPPEKLFEIHFQAIPERLSLIRVLVKEVAECFGCDKGDRYMDIDGMNT